VTDMMSDPMSAQIINLRTSVGMAVAREQDSTAPDILHDSIKRFACSQLLLRARQYTRYKQLAACSM
jgi:hypothetical protein